MSGQQQSQPYIAAVVFSVSTSRMTNLFIVVHLLSIQD
jgi:hypothetical protein